MMAKLTEALLRRLRAWSDKERGRQAKIASALEVSPQTVNDWFAGRKQLMGEQALRIQDFLKKQARRKSKKPKQLTPTLEALKSEAKPGQ